MTSVKGKGEDIPVHKMQENGEVEVQVHSFLILALDR
jgi:hypothetical protein